MVRVRHEDKDLEQAEADPQCTGGLSQPLVKAFRKRMQTIRDAPDERDFYKLASLRFEKLKGRRSHERSMRLNDQFRLILRLEEDSGEKVVVIVGIEDYH